MTDFVAHIHHINLKKLFNNTDDQFFASQYMTQEDCLAFLASEKWKDGYTCRKCGHHNYCQGKTPYARRCTRCKHDESATAHTIFHRCKVDLPNAFRITYMLCNEKEVSSHELSRRLHLRQMTCWKLKQKIEVCMRDQQVIKD